MKVFALALALLFAVGPLEGAAKKIKTPRSAAARRYKAKRNGRAYKSRKASRASHAGARVN